MGGRSRWAIALIAAELRMLAVAGPAVAGGASVTTVPGAPLGGALVPGPDRLLWHAEWTMGESPSSCVVRVHRARIAIPGGEARAIPFRLTRRAMARLRKQGQLDPYTAVDIGGGYIAGRIHVR